MNTIQSEKIAQHAQQIGMTFGEALSRIRMEYSLSHTALANRVGKSKEEIKAWEQGKNYPSGREAARLKGMIPRIGPFLSLIPKKIATPDAPSLSLEESQKPITDELPVLPDRKSPTSFSEALLQERLLAGLDQEEVGQLLEVTGQAISSWEVERSTPVEQHYKALVNLFPNLKNVPEPKWRDILPPNGGKGITRNEGNSNGNGQRRLVITSTSTWRTRVGDLYATLGQVEKNLAQMVLSGSNNQEDAVSKIDQIIDTFQKIRQLIIGHNASPTKQKIAIKPMESTASSATGTMGAAARWGVAMVNAEVASAQITELEASLEKAKVSLIRATTEAEEAKKEVMEEARKEAIQRLRNS